MMASKALSVNLELLAWPQNALCDLALHHLSNLSSSSFPPPSLSPVTLTSLVCLKPTDTLPPQDLCTCFSLCLEHFSPQVSPGLTLYFLKVFTHRPLCREAVPATLRVTRLLSHVLSLAFSSIYLNLLLEILPLYWTVNLTRAEMCVFSIAQLRCLAHSRYPTSVK